MAGTDNMLLHIDTIVADGVALEIEDASATISGAMGYTNATVMAASGNDAQKRQRVARLLKCNLLFTGGVSVAQLEAMQNIQITARDSKSGRRALMPVCSIAEVGDIGSGPVAVTFNVLQPIQWL